MIYDFRMKNTRDPISRKASIVYWYIWLVLIIWFEPLSDKVLALNIDKLVVNKVLGWLIYLMMAAVIMV